MVSETGIIRSHSCSVLLLNDDLLFMWQKMIFKKEAKYLRIYYHLGLSPLESNQKKEKKKKKTRTACEWWIHANNTAFQEGLSVLQVSAFGQLARPR